MMTRVPVTLAVEGTSDAAVASKLLECVGLTVGIVHVTNGKKGLDAKIRAFNHAARQAPWLVLRDLDHDEECPGALCSRLLPLPSSGMRLRIAVRMIESWLLADRVAVGNFLGVATTTVPAKPDALAHPKTDFVNLARRSRRRAIREDMVPAPGTSSQVGPGYTARIEEFAGLFWCPEAAAESSPSLARCLKMLRAWGT